MLFPSLTCSRLGSVGIAVRKKPRKSSTGLFNVANVATHNNAKGIKRVTGTSLHHGINTAMNSGRFGKKEIGKQTAAAPRA
jgi:hypothetical protein